MALKKGDRVEFRQRGSTEMSYGVVVKAGVKPTVVLDDGIHEVRGPALAFHLSTHPRPNQDPPLPIDRWGIKGYKAAGGEETERFECRITLDGKPVLVASNGGTGGCNGYYPLGAGTRDTENQLAADVKASIEAVGGSDFFEPVDFWLQWKQHAAIYKTFTQEVKEWMQDMEKYKPSTAIKETP